MASIRRRMASSLVLLMSTVIVAPWVRSVAAAPTSTAPVVPLDLSYKNHLNPNVLAESLRTFIDSQFTSDDSDFVIELDVSGSSLRDDGMARILDVCKGAQCSFHLMSRQNQLTQRGAAHILEFILEQNNTESNDVSPEPNATTTLPRRVVSLDLCWNNLGAPQGPGKKSFCRSLEKLIRRKGQCPHTIRLDRSGIGPPVCRAIAKGLMQRYTRSSATRNGDDKDLGESCTVADDQPLSLYFSGNSNLGDASAAAIAAAIRTINSQSKESSATLSSFTTPILGTLDFSACGVSDTGAEALALALEKAKRTCIEDLVLSSNSVTDQGASALARSIASASSSSVGRLELNGNQGVGDRGMIALAEAISSGKLNRLDIRSCHVQADGASALGKALCNTSENVQVDLSGNPIGILRGKVKKDGGKYSASRLKSKASATAAAYMSQGFGFLKKGLKEVGMDSVLGSTSGESDDEAEASMDVASDLSDPTKARCGIKALVNAFLEEIEIKGKRTTRQCIQLGLRHCCLDHSAADALAAMLVTAREYGIGLELDIRLNQVLEEEMVAALQGDNDYSAQLSEMAERHTDALEALRSARQMADEAGRSFGSQGTYYYDELDQGWDVTDVVDDNTAVSSSNDWDSDEAPSHANNSVDTEYDEG